MAAELEPQELWREILDFERTSSRESPRKASAIRSRFGISIARYHQLLNRILDRPEALKYDPVLVHRLRRLRESRRRSRSVRPVAADP